MDCIARLRRKAFLFLGRRVAVVLSSGRIIVGRIVRVALTFLVLRRIIRGVVIFTRIFFRNIKRIKLV